MASETHEPPPNPGQFRPLAGALALLGAVASCLIRVSPGLHPPNVTPVGALGLYGGARLPLWQALAPPIGGMVVTDVILQQAFGMAPFNRYVYASLVFN